MNKSIPFTFSELLKEIRKSRKINQQEFADILNVSKILIGKLESRNKEPSRKFVLNLANKLKVHPSSIMPFISFDSDLKMEDLSLIERKLIKIGMEIQKKIISVKSKNL